MYSTVKREGVRGVRGVREGMGMVMVYSIVKGGGVGVRGVRGVREGSGMVIL